VVIKVYNKLYDPAAPKNAGVISKILQDADQAAEMIRKQRCERCPRLQEVAKEADCAKGTTQPNFSHPRNEGDLQSGKKIDRAYFCPAEQKLAELVARSRNRLYLEWGR